MENLEQPPTGLKISQARGVWLKTLDEDYTAQVRERSLHGDLVCSEEIPENILESNIFCILEYENVTEIVALYKISLSKSIFIFES